MNVSSFLVYCTIENAVYLIQAYYVHVFMYTLSENTFFNMEINTSHPSTIWPSW